ncbi:peptidoglycan/LPS O-acetylase OafA/YrhL [Mycolicibacterium sp. BK634]|uniref:acyltransferase family protein n=1 Tax=Mycobacterium sp. BK086 TaxID=2512165 RepID=UPI00105FDA2E|nr:acyltransferase family protein [Mycobacterium sp. BK086]MBB3753007.1 peptidoglycan/LPS O-acetylase OafA/YrhL [Mycolicibacterium sp. BK634]TDO09225.1 peptidoglycan/LPS O-acetylase OafA/YrhL [Mycobacterium sp. BK086]
MTLRQADSVSPTEERQDSRAEQNKFRPDIEGLRAVAVVAVVLFHAAVPGLGGGYVGVDVFFVISGFLITGLLWREVSTSGSVRLRSFYGARARRLLPASAAVGVVTMIGATFLLPPLQAPTVLADGIWSALYISNYRFMFEGVNYFSAANHLTPSPFLHYWSLGVEEQFYLVWAPLILGVAWLMRLARRRSTSTAAQSQRPYLAALTLVAILSFGVSFVLTHVMPAAAFYSLPTRAWQLAVGGLVALTAGHWRRLPAVPAGVLGWAGLALILLACTWFSPTTPFPGTAALLPTVGAALVIGAGCALPARGCGRLLGLSPMRAIGRISYSWYLWHWPVLVLTPLIVGHPLGLVGRVTAALLSAGLAWLTLTFIENPLRFNTTIRNSAGRSLGLGAVATAIAVCAGLVLTQVVPSTVGRGAPAAPLTVAATPVPAGAGIDTYDIAIRQAVAQVQAAVAASADLTAVPSNLVPPLANAAAEEKGVYLGGCMRDFLETGHPECASGDTASATTVALVGDSHAAMWNPAFRQLADERHWRVETLAKSGCPLLDLTIRSPLLNREYTECEQWRAEITSRLRAEHPRLVVLSTWRGYGSADWPSGFAAYDRAWLDSLTRIVKQLRDIGSQVLVLGPIPDPQSVVPVCLSAHLDDVTACEPKRAGAVNPAGIAAEAAAVTAGGGQYADLTDLFCTADRCPVIVDNTLVYFDWNHVTLEYSRALGPVIGAFADRALASR